MADVLSARGLDIGYDGDVVVSGVNFELPAGQAIALIGTNGSGKTTLLKTVVCLLPAIRGQLEVFGSSPGANPARRPGAT